MKAFISAGNIWVPSGALASLAPRWFLTLLNEWVFLYVILFSKSVPYNYMKLVQHED